MSYTSAWSVVCGHLRCSLDDILLTIVKYVTYLRGKNVASYILRRHRPVHAKVVVNPTDEMGYLPELIVLTGVRLKQHTVPCGITK